MNINKVQLYLGKIKCCYYLFTFLILLIVTFFPYIIVQKKFFSDSFTLFVISLFTIIQVMLHLKCFFHLEYFKDYYWSIIISFFSLLVVFIIILGSIWIMNDLH